MFQRMEKYGVGQDVSQQTFAHILADVNIALIATVQCSFAANVDTQNFSQLCGGLQLYTGCI